MREAIRRLEAEGLVIYRPNAGAQVAPADPSAYDDELTVLAVLEGHATALAAPLLDELDIAEQTLIELADDGLTATAETDVVWIPQNFENTILARYHDTVVKRDGRWLFQRREGVPIAYRPARRRTPTPPPRSAGDDADAGREGQRRLRRRARTASPADLRISHSDPVDRE